MDDTLWIARSKDDLINIIAIANSFYELNSIQVNWAKSDLLTNLSDTQTIITNVHGNNHVITSVKLKNSV